MSTINDRLAQELTVRTQQVHAAVELLDGGATVPFIARYRKEATGGLDDSQLRQLAERLVYLRELEERRATILDSIREQGKLTDELEQLVLTADTKQRLEDLYLPYKPKRRTKGQMAREAGIEPLAKLLLQDPNQDPEQCAAEYLNPEAGYSEIKKVLEGARYILMERFAEDAELLGELRNYLARQGLVRTTVVEDRAGEGEKFRDYFDFHEPVAQMPSHRALAVFRGLNEGILKCDLVPNKHELEEPPEVSIGERKIARHVGIDDRGRPADPWLAKVVRWTWRVKIHASLKLDLFADLRERAEEEAIRVFGKNLKDLLMAAPAGPKVTMGLDPGFRTGVKVALVDETGKLLHHGTIFPHAPQKRWNDAVHQLSELCRQHQVHLVSIGNGTASRETDRLVAELIRLHPELSLQKVMVSEAGASVYSASELAAGEFPDLDVSFRGAVSIARRLQDPLAELVKIEPKAIGVGQYQHDVNQSRLSRTLDSVVEDCVNAVGVDVNMASVPLLTHVSGFNRTLAENLVAHRNTHGRFEHRGQLKKVARLGPRAFEQAAGFMRIRNGTMPLDASAVHPEAYPVVRRMAAHCGVDAGQLIGNRELVKSLNPAQFTDERFGLPTVHDILAELEKPGRDPRPEFKMALFAEGVETIGDLQAGMVLEGVVTNVTNFGAFVDIGVHQDGLVHISAMSNRFIKDPHEIVRAGDIVKVKVMGVEVHRKRIALSMRLDDQPGQESPRRGQAPKPKQGQPPNRSRAKAEPRSAFGSSLEAALKRRK